MSRIRIGHKANGDARKPDRLPIPTCDRVLVHAGQQWYCIACGGYMHPSTRSGKYIRCPNPRCTQYEWELLRPDLASCELIGYGPGKPAANVKSNEKEKHQWQHAEVESVVSVSSFGKRT